MSKRLKPTRKYELERTTAMLMRRANLDPDIASMFVLGDSLEKCDGCIVILKGRDSTVWIRDLLIRNKLLNPKNKI